MRFRLDRFPLWRGFRYVLAGLSGVLMVLGFPKIDLSLLSWIALVPLLVSIHNADWKESLKLGLVTGVVYFGGIMNWIMVLTPYSTIFWVTLGFIVLTLYLSSYVIIFTVSLNFISGYWIPDVTSDTQRGTSSVQYSAYSFLSALIWTATEILRAHVVTGLPWASLGYTQWKNLPLIQISSITGVYGVTFLIAMINGAIAGVILDIRRWKSSLKAIAVPFAILIACLAFGWVSLQRDFHGEKMRIVLVPGNIRQGDKIRSWGDKADWIFDRYVQMTYQAIAEKPDMIVWPETAVPQFIFPRSFMLDRLEFLVERWGAYLLIGVPSYEGEYPRWKVYNSAFLLSPSGKEIDRYHKIHLVPLGEYFPLKRYLPKKVQDMVTGVSDFDRGNRYTVFSASPARIGVVICFESIFPQISRKFINEGANVIGILTNDAWFEGTYAPQQHFSMAIFRAIENRTFVFRCANHGVSCIIDPYGRILGKIQPEDEEGYLAGEVGLCGGGTFYTKHGDYLPWGCLVIALCLVIQVRWCQRKSGGLYVVRDTFRSRGSQKKDQRSRRSSLTSQTKKKR